MRSERRQFQSQSIRVRCQQALSLMEGIRSQGVSPMAKMFRTAFDTINLLENLTWMESKQEGYI